ncbi:MAG: hypothetical protein ACRDJL_11805 [Actinomycetota bacterium]
MRVSRNLVMWLFASLLVLGVVSAAVATSLGQAASPTVTSADDDGTPDQGPGCCEPNDDRNARGNSPDDDGTPDQGPGCCEPGDHGGDDRDDRHGDNSGPSDNSGASANSGPGNREDDDDDDDDDDTNSGTGSSDSGDSGGTNSGHGSSGSGNSGHG